MSDSIYIRSTSKDPELMKEGEPAWSLYVSKRGNGRLIAVATEGSVAPRSFTSMPFSCRRVEIPLVGSRLTAKVRQLGIDALIVALVTEGRAPLDYKFDDEAKAA